MGHNPSRRTLKDTAASAQYEVDQYKAGSIWGAWRGLKQEVCDRYFNADEIAWITRYGSRLDQIACMVAVPRNERERQFLLVCMGNEWPTSDRERLWLRAQMVCRYEGCVERASRCSRAEETAGALAAECTQLRRDLREYELETSAAIARAMVDEGNQAWRLSQRLALMNVRKVDGWSPNPVMLPLRYCS